MADGLDRVQPMATIKEAADTLGLSLSAAYDAAKRGEIPVVRFGRVMRVPTPWLRKVTNGEAA